MTTSASEHPASGAAAASPDSDDGPPTLVHCVQERGARSGSALFVSGLDGADLTYRQAQSRAEALAQALTARGVRPGGRVGLYLPNTPAWPVASLAVWRLGCSVVACGTLLSPAEATRAFTLAGAAAVVTTEPEALADHTALRVDEAGRLIGEDGDGPVPPPRLPDPSDEAVVFFTSGTTGAPKGVPHSHRNLVRWGRQVAAAYTRTAGFRPTTAPAHAAPGVIFTPFGHIGGYLSLSFRVWTGRHVVLVRKFSPEAVGALLDRYPFTALQLTPTMVHMLATTEQDLPINRLHYVTSSTAPLAESTRDAFERRYGIPVLQAYGMTEVGTITQERLTDIQQGRRPPNSVGRPAAGVRLRILDEEGNEMPPGQVGEVAVSSPTVAAYLGERAEPWLRTGDLGHLDPDGFLVLSGRRGDKIIVGGFNVYPAEVEEVLRRSPHIRDVVVVGLPDDRLGERPVAAVVWTDRPRPEEVRAEARAALAHYKVPREWVGVEAIPLTPRGKVNRRRVRAELQRRVR